MTRKEIYRKILEMLEIEQNHLRNKFEFGEISFDNYEELSCKRSEEYREYIVDLALCTDKDLEEKMKFVINTNLDTF
jgi:hypothetical protein cdivTM_09561